MPMRSHYNRIGKYINVFISIILQDLYGVNSLRSALQHEGRQYGYNTIQIRGPCSLVLLVGQTWLTNTASS